jgi:mono/diheme cytochrome c family protein
MRFLAGILVTLLALAVGAFVVTWFGLFPAGADTGYLPMEKWAANRAVNTEIRREMPHPPYPYGPSTDAVVLAGAKLYMQNCALCHGSGAAEESATAKGMYIKPPQFPKHGVDDDPEGETYWKIEHGYRFTGMPSYKAKLTEEQIWQIAYFLKRAPHDLPTAAKAVWDGQGTVALHAPK